MAQRLVSEHRGGGALRVCLACRNLEKAESVRQSLLAKHPEVAVDLLQVDTSSPHSAIAAAQEIQKRSVQRAHLANSSLHFIASLS